jgi:DNA repair protein RecO
LTDLAEIEGLILRKGPFSETSLVLHLLTREHGQVHFLARGALRGGKRKFPAADLFRHVRVMCRRGQPGALQTARGIELVTAFDGVAAIPQHYAAASWLARFALDNSMAEDPVPRLFAALFGGLTRLSGPRLPTCRPVCLGVVLTALDEHGWLPAADGDAALAAAIRQVLGFAADPDAAMPALSDEAWLELRRRVAGWVLASSLRLPPGADTPGG